MNNYDFPNLSLKFRKTGSGFKQAGSRTGLDLNGLNSGWVKKRARALNGLGRLRVGLKSGWVAKRVGSKTGWVTKTGRVKTGWVKKTGRVKNGLGTFRVRSKTGWVSG